MHLHIKLYNTIPYKSNCALYIKKRNSSEFLFRLSGWRDSNSRPPAPKAGILTGLNYIPHTSFSKASAKVLLFFDMTKYFLKKMLFFVFFFALQIVWYQKLDKILFLWTNRTYWIPVRAVPPHPIDNIRKATQCICTIRFYICTSAREVITTALGFV